MASWWDDIQKGFGSKNGANALIGLGTGLLQGNTFAKGLAAGGQGFMQGAELDQQYAAEAEEKAVETEQTNATRSWLEQQGFTDLVPLVDAGQAGLAYGEALKRMQPGYGQADTTANQNDFLFARSNGYEGSFEDWVSGSGGQAQYGLTPIWGQMPDGSFGYGVQGRDGTFKPVDTGDMAPLDPRTLAGERAYGTAVGGAQGEAAAAAPSDIVAAQTALDLVTSIKNDPELPWATGTSAGLGGNAVPGTGRFGFQAKVDQAKSGAFLTAIQEMRGMGALSNAEGQTATQAVTRMNTALSEADFKAALDEYSRIIDNGMKRAQARLGAGPSVGSGPSATPGSNFVYNPATGRLEQQ